MRLVACCLAALFIASFAPAAQGEEASSAKGPVKIALGANFGFFTNVPDLRYRRDTYEDIFGERKGVPTQRYGFIAQNFALDFLLQSEGSYSSAFQVALGFKDAMGGDNLSPQGSEFSGMRLSHKMSFFNGRILSSLGYGLMRSDFLRLYAKHHEYRLRLDYIPDPSSLNPVDSPFFVRIGPEVIHASPTGDDVKDRYGLQWAMHLLMRYQGQLSEKIPASLGIQGFFRRIDGFTIDQTKYGGAGLLTLSPVTEIMLIENLWVGLRADIPVLRPIDREEAFSDAELPGLYGTAFGFFLRTATF